MSESTEMDITLIANLVYAASILLVALFGLMGFVKGFWKAFIAMLVQMALMFVAVFLSPAIGSGLGNIDLTAFGVQESFMVGNTAVKVSSLRQTICDAITASGVVSPLSGQSIYESALGITDMLLSLAAYCICSVLAVIFSWAIASLVYHTVLKWFLPRRVRLKAKGKPIGAIAGALMGAMAMTLAIAPFSSLAKYVRRNEGVLNTLSQKLSPMGQTYLSYAEGFAQSAYGSGWASGMDDLMMNGATAVTINGAQVSIKDFGALAASLAVPFSQALNSYDDAQAFDYTVLALPDQSVGVIVDALIGSNIVMGVMPALAQAAVNYVANASGTDLSGLDFSGVDFKNDLSTAKEIYDRLYATGAVSDYLTGKDVSFSADDEPDVLYAMKRFGALESVKANMPYLMSLAAQGLEESLGYTLLSEDPASYQGIDWSFEFQRAAEAAFDLSALAGLPMSFASFQGDQLVRNIYAKLDRKANIAALETALVGNQSDHPYGLLDSKLLDPKIVDYAQVSSLLFHRIPTLSRYLTEKEVSDSLEKLDQESIQNEVSVAVKMLRPLKGLLDYLSDINKAEIDFNDEIEASYLHDIVVLADGSKVLHEVLPAALTKSLPGIFQSTFGSDGFFGITTQSLDLADDDALFQDLATFLGLMPEINQTRKALSTQGSLAEKIQGLDPNAFREVMTAFVESKVFNPVRVFPGDDGINRVVTNANVNTLVTNVITDFGFKDFGVTVNPDVALANAVWTDADGDHPEIDYLTAIIVELQSEIESGMLTSDGFDLGRMTGSSLSNLVSKMGQSGVFRQSLPGFLDQELSGFSKALGIEMDYKDVPASQWDESAKALGRAYDLAKPLGLAPVSQDPDPVDLSVFKGDSLNSLLTELKKTLFVEPRRKGNAMIDPLGDFVFRLFRDSGLSQAFRLSPNPDVFYSVPTGLTASGNSHRAKWAWSKASEERTVSDGVIADVTTDGEIASLSKALMDYLAIGDRNPLTDGKAWSVDIRTILGDFEASEALGDSLSQAIQAVLQTVPGQSLDIDGHRIEVDVSNASFRRGVGESDVQAAVDYFYLAKATDAQGKIFVNANDDPLASAFDSLFFLSPDELSSDRGGVGLTDLDAITRIKGRFEGSRWSLGEKGNITLTRGQVLYVVLTDAIRSPLLSAPRLGTSYSVRDELFASLYAIARLDLVAFGKNVDVSQSDYMAIRAAVLSRLSGLSDEDWDKELAFWFGKDFDPKTGTVTGALIKLHGLSGLTDGATVMDRFGIDDLDGSMALHGIRPEKGGN